MREYLEEEGKFNVFVTSNPRILESKDKKTPYVSIWMETKDGKAIESKQWLTENTIERTTKTLQDCFGFDGKYSGITDNNIDWSGMQCQIVTELQEYNGKNYCKVKWLNPHKLLKVSDNTLENLKKLTNEDFSEEVKTDDIPF